MITRVLRETKHRDSGISVAEIYYRNERDGLFRYASSGYPDVLPFLPSAKRLEFRGREFTCHDEIVRFIEDGTGPVWPWDTLRVYETPTQTLKYTLRIGSRWDPNPSSEWPIEMAAVGEELVSVPGGTYNCIVVQLFHDLDDDGEWDSDFDYFHFVCDQGLIRRYVFIKDMAVTLEWGDTVALYDVILEDNLTAIDVR
jgi:hypothetical protein